MSVALAKQELSTGSIPDTAQFHEALAALEGRVHSLEKSQPEDCLSMVVFSGDYDKLLAAFVVATGAAAMGSDVNMFFTFWGLSAIKKQRIYRGKSLLEKMLAFMLPKGPNHVPTSNMNMGGIGPRFFDVMMKKKNVQKLTDLIDLARDLDVTFQACQMSMDVMAITKEELIDDIAYCGVAGFLGDADRSRITLFI